MVNLQALHVGRTSAPSSPRLVAGPPAGTKDSPLEVDAGRPRKKAKVADAKEPEGA
ncbi:unnamed protein product, partial [Musa textilis]